MTVDCRAGGAALAANERAGRTTRFLETLVSSMRLVGAKIQQRLRGRHQADLGDPVLVGAGEPGHAAQPSGDVLLDRRTGRAQSEAIDELVDAVKFTPALTGPAAHLNGAATGEAEEAQTGESA
ncbi:hypothetical protein GCM10009602_09710 [Nocardiopsis tropica]|uniref:Uncharacterized protein n=1 Tax=Nocardiopsis tropica TaxID=109330 RepID=A0ABU7KK46_9ACTN|nr:hypothetical protein [Nocardiopsis umidischolae]MEE2049668.1 hypothetical protein [Nocardiopsis umidischolae]